MIAADAVIAAAAAAVAGATDVGDGCDGSSQPKRRCGPYDSRVRNDGSTQRGPVRLRLCGSVRGARYRVLRHVRTNGPGRGCDRIRCACTTRSGVIVRRDPMCVRLYTRTSRDRTARRTSSAAPQSKLSDGWPVGADVRPSYQHPTYFPSFDSLLSTRPPYDPVRENANPVLFASIRIRSCARFPHLVVPLTRSLFVPDPCPPG